jgi:imidazolonepropionase-like amidohydrolase
VPPRLPALLADPTPRPGRLWLTNARLLDGTSAPVKEGAAVLVEDGRIVRVGSVGEDLPEGAESVDLGGRTLMPGLIDVHTHLYPHLPEPSHGAEPIWPGTGAHFLAADLQETLRMGFTTLRDVGSYGDLVFEARQAARYGAFRAPRTLTCGRIISATSPGGRFFDGMYVEVDGTDAVRRGVREQLRRGADYVKLMTTGARSVELEDPDPVQMTRDEVAAAVDEAHRLGYRVAAHAEGLAGTELAVELGVDTIEHGMYLNQRPDLLERMAASGQVLVPTLSCFYAVAGLGDAVGEGEAAAGGEWADLLVDLALHNLEQAGLTLRAAREAGVPIALGHDWSPIANASIELLRMIHHGLSEGEAIVAATGTAASALGLAEHIGTIEPGKLADLLVVDGDPLEESGVLRDRARIWLVLQLGLPVAGAALERSVGE